MNDEQQTSWNGRSGRAWVDAQEILDQMFRPFEQRLVDEVSKASATRVLDVGCGTGATTLAIARHLGTKGSAVGVDISNPMLTLARERAQRENSSARFIQADAQTYAFEPATFDLIVSRFGVMLFEDSVQAFTNLRRATTNAAKIRVIVFRSGADNPFMTTAERAAAPLLPNLPPRRPDAPGQFAFGDQHKVRSILDASGWTDINITPIDMTCTFPERELIGYFTRLGLLGSVLPDVDDQTRTRVIEAARTAFEPFVHGDEVRFTAACWLVAAG